MVLVVNIFNDNFYKHISNINDSWGGDGKLYSKNKFSMVFIFNHNPVFFAE